jgi:D-glycero-alpha-D-manno-heptose 1-phosphate guanylyltransferase
VIAVRWTALVLAGGRGTRARAIDPDTPKALFMVGGLPAVVRQVQWLATCASSPPVQIVVLTDHHGDRVAAALPRRIEDAPVSIVRSAPRGTVAALSTGLAVATTDRVLCLNSDTIVGCALQELMGCWPMPPRAMTLLCSDHAEAPNLGEVVVDDGRLVRMQPAPRTPTDCPGALLANVGVYLFSRDRVARSVAGAPAGASIERYLANRLVAQDLVGVHSLGSTPVIDFGTPRGWQALRDADPTEFEILHEMRT